MADCFPFADGQSQVNPTTSVYIGTCLIEFFSPRTHPKERKKKTLT